MEQTPIKAALLGHRETSNSVAALQVTSYRGTNPDHLVPTPSDGGPALHIAAHSLY